MYIFRRTRAVKPDQIADGMAYAVEAAAKIKSVTGRDLSVSNTIFGAPNGTINFSARFESLAELADFTKKVAVDPGVTELSRKGASLFANLPSDSVLNIVSSTFEGSQWGYVAITEAVPANGKIAEAVAFGVKTQAHVAKSGLKTVFATNAFGAYGAMTWATYGQTMADIDTLQNFFATDATFQTLLLETGTLFVEGSGHNSLLQRIN